MNRKVATEHGNSEFLQLFLHMTALFLEGITLVWAGRGYTKEDALKSDTSVFLKGNVEVLGSTECKNKKVSTDVGTTQQRLHSDLRGRL